MNRAANVNTFRLATTLLAILLLVGCTSRKARLRAKYAPRPQPTVQLAFVTLYQSDFVLRERLGGTGALSSYLQSIVAQANTYLSTLPSIEPQTANLAVSIRPGQLSEFTCDFRSAGLSEEEQAEFLSTLQQIPPPEVRGGPVTAVLHLDIRSAQTLTPSPGESLLMPWSPQRQSLTSGAAPDSRP